MSFLGVACKKVVRHKIHYREKISQWTVPPGDQTVNYAASAIERPTHLLHNVLCAENYKPKSSYGASVQHSQFVTYTVVTCFCTESEEVLLLCKKFRSPSHVCAFYFNSIKFEFIIK